MRINAVTISGKVHRAESKDTTSGAVVEIRFRQTYPKQGIETPDHRNPDHWNSEWFTAEAWGKTAEYAQRLQSGDLILVEARINHQEWNDKTTGDRREKYILKANRIHLVRAATDTTQGAVVGAVGSAEVPF